MPHHLAWMRGKLEEKYELTVEVLGPNAGQQAEVRVLNRALRWTQQGVEYEADPRHVEIMTKQLGLNEAKVAVTPGTKEEGRTKTAHEQELDEPKTYEYRAITARGNYLAPDRPDIAVAVKELAKRMSKPTEGDWERLKHLGRYLKGRPRMVHLFEWQGVPTEPKIFTDADWAGN